MILSFLVSSALTLYHLLDMYKDYLKWDMVNGDGDSEAIQSLYTFRYIGSSYMNMKWYYKMHKIALTKSIKLFVDTMATNTLCL